MSFGLPFNNEPGFISSDPALDLTGLLPASTRTADQTIVCPGDDMHSFLQKDLCVDRLNKIDSYLWLAGRPMPPRPLNYQVASSREITTDDRIDMHLVWESTQKVHIKPIPRYLFSSQFWEKYLACKEQIGDGQRDRDAHEPDRKENIYKCALGFLSSYIALIQFESDLAIARTHHLLPSEVTWKEWVSLVHQLLENGATDPQNINSRYLYGELRLSRLNKIYAWRLGSVSRGYQFTYQTFGELFRTHLTTLTATTIYIALVLTAMQVGLGTTRLAGNLTFQNASWGFTVFSILGPLIGIGLVGMIGIFQFSVNMAETRRFKKRQFARFERMKARGLAA